MALPISVASTPSMAVPAPAFPRCLLGAHLHWLCASCYRERDQHHPDSCVNTDSRLGLGRANERRPANSLSFELLTRTRGLGGWVEKIIDGHCAYLDRGELKKGTSESSLLNPQKYCLQLPYFRQRLWPEQSHSWFQAAPSDS